MSGAVIILKQNRLMRSFAKEGATDPSHSVTLEELGFRESWVFRRMVKRGVFVAIGSGRYYLDEEAAQQFRRLRRAKIRAILLVWLVVCIVVILAFRH